MPSIQAICPLCSSTIQEYHLNFDCDFLMCENQKCPYPFLTQNFTEHIVDLPVDPTHDSAHSAQPAHTKKGRKRKACSPLESSESPSSTSSKSSKSPKPPTSSENGNPVPHVATLPPNDDRVRPHPRLTTPFSDGQSAAVHARAPPPPLPSPSTPGASTMLHMQEHQITPSQVTMGPTALLDDDSITSLLAGGDEMVAACMERQFDLSDKMTQVTASTGADGNSGTFGTFSLEDIQELLSPGLSEDGSSATTSEGGIEGLDDVVLADALLNDPAVLSFAGNINMEDFNFLLEMGEGTVAL